MTKECREVRELLQDWMDGTLDESRREPVRGHLERCDACRDELAAFESLRERAAALPSRISPARDLWPAIEQRLDLPWWKRLARWAALGGFRQPAAALAAAAALGAVALGVWLWRAQPVPPSPGLELATEAATPSTPTFSAQAELARSEDGTLVARRDLLEAVQRQRDHLAPETVAILEENMHIIDQAIGQVRAALDEDPLNQQLHRLLAAHYQHEVQLLKRVSGA